MTTRSHARTGMGYQNDKTRELSTSNQSAILVVFSILTLSNIVSGAIGYYSSIDVRGWWPVGLICYSGVDILYALAFSQISKIARHFTMRTIVYYTAALSAVQVTHAVVYYLFQPNWEAIREGRTPLTPLQALVNSDYSFYGMYVCFLGIALLHALVLRRMRR